VQASNESGVHEDSQMCKFNYWKYYVQV